MIFLFVFKKKCYDLGKECETPCKFYLGFLRTWNSKKQVNWDVKSITEYAGAWERTDKFPGITKMWGITWCSKTKI